MLVGFLGAPCSGKTTTATRLFADLKDKGSSVEFISEKARSYIAWKKYTYPQEPFCLTDEDQFAIAQAQYQAEVIMRSVCGPDLDIITDTSVLNSLLYMTPEFRERPDVRTLMAMAVRQYDILYLCQPVGRLSTYDPNRVHSEEQALALHEDLERIFAEYVPSSVHAISLNGPSYVRLHHAMAELLQQGAPL
jgi:nicotinamide riboside kinase